ncbi:MAG: GNAT family N-acetyltransferase [Candidatus Hermodarchaeota archaeon]
MKIEDVTFTDLKNIMILEIELFGENAFTRQLMEELIRHNTFFLKLVDDTSKNEIIGFIIAIRDKIDRINIINFLIDPNFQNKGYGALLLQNIIERIKQIKEVKKVVLNVQVSNTAAIKLYEKFNFKKNPNELNNYYPSGENAYFMELEI